ncbi:MAG: MFS transporter [Candidatus Nanopelagicales bacterium]
MHADVTREAGAKRRGAWGIVGAAFVMLALNTGFGFYALGAFSRSYVDNTGISLTAASAGATVFLLCNGLGGLPVARLLPRYGIRRVMTVSVIISAACLALLGSISQAWHLWLLYAVYGLASAGFSMIPASTMVLDRFMDRSPARPLAVAAAGLSVGGALFTPIVTAAVQANGLQITGIVMAAVVVAVLIPIAGIAKPARPTAALPSNPQDSSTSTAVQVDISEPLVPGEHIGRIFATVCIAFGLLIMSQVAAITHMLTLGQERDIVNPALAVSLIAATSVVGRVLGIIVLPHVPLKILSFAMAVFQVTSLVVIATAHSLPALIVGAMLMGVTVGNNQVFIPLWILGLFGVARYTHLFARANLYTSLGIAAAPLYVGVTHQISGDYFIPFLLVAAGSAVAGLLILTLPARHQTA